MHFEPSAGRAAPDLTGSFVVNPLDLQEHEGVTLRTRLCLNRVGVYDVSHREPPGIFAFEYIQVLYLCQEVSGNFCVLVN